MTGTNNNRFLWLVAAAVLGLALIFVVSEAQLVARFTNNPSSVTIKDHQKTNLVINNERQIEVEVVTSPQAITQGLSGRDQIGADGMLFILPQKRVASFWMKEMRFGLDIVWISDGKVIDISANIPAPDPTTPLEQLPLYSSSQPVEMVLEVPAGQAEALGIKVGTQVSLKN